MIEILASVGLATLLIVAWHFDRLPRVPGDVKAIIHYGRSYKWILTLESQGPVIALLNIIYAGISCSEPNYVFVDALDVTKPGADPVRWNLCYLAVTGLYLALQYQSPLGVFRRRIPIVLWSMLGVLTLNEEFYGSPATTREYSSLTHNVTLLIALMAWATCVLWIIADVPESQYRGPSAIDELQSPLLETELEELLDEGGLVERLTYTFATPYYQHGHTSVKDLPPPKPEELVEVQDAHFKMYYNPETKGKDLGKASIAYLKDDMTHMCIMYFLGVHFQLINALVINGFFEVLRHHVAEQSSASLKSAVSWAMILFICVTAEIVDRNRIMFHGWRYGIWLDAVYSIAVYEKCLKVSVGEMRKIDESEKDEASEPLEISSSKGTAVDQASKGRLINMLSQDVDRISWMLNIIPDLFIGPYRLTILFIILFGQTSKYTVMCCLIWICIFAPIIYYIFHMETVTSERTQEATDVRLRSETEFLHAVRALKVYGWVKPFIDKIREKRRLEMRQRFVNEMYSAACTVCWYNLSTIIVIAVFGMRFLFTSAPLDAKNVITTLSVISAMQFPLTQVPFAMLSFAEGRTSFKRIKAYLSLDEKPPAPHCFASKDFSFIIQITNGDIRWNGSDTIILKGVNLCVKKGQLVTIIGKVGSGKTCLLETLIGESDLLRGDISVNGSIAYAAQGAWIQSTTLRDNILCGLPFNEQWYATVVQACCLIPDFKQLHKGDMTQVGEQGITLSGGQKQRIALARAVYAQTDIVILDDILSAVDFMVAQQIVDIVFKHLLKDKTVILATHRISVAKHADLIVILDQAICNVYRSVTEATTHPVFKELAELTMSQQEDPSESKAHAIVDAESVPSPLRSVKEEDTLDNDTTLQVGHTTRWINLHSYIESCGGYCISTFLMLLCLLYAFVASFSGYYMSYYADHSRPRGIGGWYITATQGSLTVTAMELTHLTLMVIYLISLAFYSRRGSLTVHSKLVTRVQNARMAFFESTPTGNIISRLSKDMAVIDESLPASIMAVVDEVGWITANTMTILVSSPATCIFFIPLFWLLQSNEKTYTRAYATVIRLMSALKAPVYTHVTETLNGLTTIRAFKYDERHRQQFCKLLGDRVRAEHSYYLGNRWIGNRLEIANAIFIFATALVSVFLAKPRSLTYMVFAVGCATRISYDLSWLIRQVAMNDGNLVSISRLAAYDDPNICPQEPQVFAPNNEKFHEATVEFKNVKMRYGPDLPWVLNDLSFFIPNGAKVGVIGRTGAGKTSLLASLLRLVDIECGDIQVDGRSIFSMSIEHIRNEFAVIPQDPVLFCGTLRLNLDPMNEHTDIEIEEALRRAHLLDFVRGLPRQLDTSIDSTGSNISFGQRQLVCLARVLLKDFSILLMDEATSSVDPATDQLIQTCIRQEFGSKTLITIAHRIQTILDYDLILGMRDGTVVEFDTPTNLLNDPKSLLSSMLGSDNASSGLPTVPAIL